MLRIKTLIILIFALGIIIGLTKGVYSQQLPPIKNSTQAETNNNTTTNNNVKIENQNENNTIKEVKVVLNVEQTQIHDSLKQRIEESVKKVGEKAMVGKKQEDIAVVKDSLEQALKKIFSQVLTGFYVTSVEIKLEDIPTIYLSIAPNSQIVEKVIVKIKLNNVHQSWQPILDEEIKKVGDKINPILLGIPVSSSEWASATITPILDAIVTVNTMFPGFNVQVALDFGKETIVYLQLFPKEPIIKSLDIRGNSKTLPIMSIGRVKYLLRKESSILIGLPVEFVNTHKDYLEKTMVHFLGDKWVQKLDLVVKFDLNIDVVTKINFTLESAKFSTDAEGLLNFGLKNDKGPEIRARLGMNLKDKTQIFYRIVLLPSNLTLHNQIGIGYNEEQVYFAGVMYDFNTSNIMGIGKLFSGKFILELLPVLSELDGEASISYKYKNFIHFQVVTQPHLGYWARLKILF